MVFAKLLPLLGLLSAATAVLGSAHVARCGQNETSDSFTNPVLYEDYPDNDIFTGPDGKFYFSASNFHFSPGAPILRSGDLVNWEPVGHSIPRLNFGDGYNLNNGRAYRGGTWASTLRFRESNGLWYWIGCVNFWHTWIFTAPSPEGPWSTSARLGDGVCYYDLGLLIDDDDTMYVVYGSGNVRVAQLSADGLSEARSQEVFEAADVGADSIEGNRMYKINGTYYILNDRPGSTTYIWKSESPWGPYESKILVDSVTPPLNGGNSPHQGSLIETAKGDWYFMSFTWAYPSGRLPVLRTHLLGEQTASPVFVKAKNKVNNGLTLSTASVTTDLYAAKNTLTHRIHGEFPVGTVELDFSSLADGDRAGLAAFRDQSASIGVYRAGDAYALTAVHGMIIDEWNGTTISTGRVEATAPVPAGARKVWLRAELDARPAGTRAANFLYSFDGKAFTTLGGTYQMTNGWAFFLGYRFGIFNYATKALGGSVKIESFTTA
ncbi:glycosyl hydrolase family 43 protein [Verticillium alfalfae VaMs.102]|uniref:Glycosyl hydrolase family 43 protein n=1 Tax=Verticillium alfalfae (strain VaMs.102 / ATCC MYA-4576 / FGSC 10136) TaxID=526221 RepID=C9SDG0_VERA1|nr:glycosyl hydrolase family 43 protein [Verticillium alfalfae VaMs.102]EEY17112.1 glycosyl hydrolase family 43 protein [Verticillium alfalfae VaMs.102]